MRRRRCFGFTAGRYNSGLHRRSNDENAEREDNMKRIGLRSKCIEADWTIRPRADLRIIVSFAFFLLPFYFLPSCLAQDVTDKMIATVNGGVETDLITYSDLRWQLALQPDTPLVN